jgi:hypothetical protein
MHRHLPWIIAAILIPHNLLRLVVALGCGVSSQLRCLPAEDLLRPSPDRNGHPRVPLAF